MLCQKVEKDPFLSWTVLKRLKKKGLYVKNQNVLDLKVELKTGKYHSCKY